MNIPYTTNKKGLEALRHPHNHSTPMTFTQFGSSNLPSNVQRDQPLGLQRNNTQPGEGQGYKHKNKYGMFARGTPLLSCHLSSINDFNFRQLID